MGTIIGRTRKDGSKAFLAQITIKKDGAIVHRESETFDLKPAANAWIVKREAELKSPGGLERKEDPTLSAVIDRYIAESKNPVLGTKAQVLRAIKNSDLGEMKCSEITSKTLVAFARELTKEVEPQTCGNYFSHLSNIFTVARPAWGYPLSRQEFDDTLTVIKKLGLIRKGNERNRRPTLEELDRLMEHFGRIREHRPSSIPMQKIVGFALFSTRRQEEITLLRWYDLDGDRILVRDMKHPGDKRGTTSIASCRPKRSLSSIQCRGRVSESSPTRPMPSAPHSRGPVESSESKICDFTTFDTQEFPVCSKWAEPFRRSRLCQVIVVGPA